MKKLSPLLVLLASFIFDSATLTAQWVRKKDGIKLRSDVPASVAYNGKLYVFMGFHDPNLEIEASSEVYDPVTNTWKILKSIPLNKARTHEGVVLIDDNVWHIGGRLGNHPGAFTNETMIYNITTDSWSQGPGVIDPATNKAIPWCAGGIALLGRTLHLFGGLVSTACNGDQNKYHLTLDVDEWLANKSLPPKWKNEKAIMPVPRNHFSTAVMSGKIYALGGQLGHDCNGGQDQQYAHVYDPVTNKWTDLTKLTAIRSHCENASFAMDGKFYMVGGQSLYGNSTNKVTIFDPAGNNGKGSWSDNAAMVLPTVYEGVSAKNINNQIILTHGGVNTSKNPQRKTYVYNVTRNPVYKLGFSAPSVKLNVTPGGSVNESTLLFTVDGIKTYAVTSNAEWLTVTKNAVGTTRPTGADIDFKVNAAGLAAGNYQAVLKAVGTGGGQAYAEASYIVNISVCGGVEVCNGVDDDCDGAIDEGCGSSGSKISVSSPVIYEGNSGAKLAAFKFTLDKASSSSVSVKYKTEHNNTDDNDFFPVSGTVTFPANNTSQTVNVTVKGDVYDEVNEMFDMILSDPVNATISVGTGTCKITDDDDYPAIRVYDTTATENSLKARIRVGLSVISGRTVTVKFKTVNGTAVASADYTAQSNVTLTFSPGQKDKYVDVVLKKDNLNEATEKFQLVLSEQQLSTIARSTATVSITNSAASAIASSSQLDVERPADPLFSVQVMPNPSSCHFDLLINGNRAHPATVRVTDILGKVVEIKTGLQTNSALRIGAGWKTGTYIAQITQGNERKVIKLIRLK